MDNQMDAVPAAVIKKESKKKNRKVLHGGPWVAARKIVQYLALVIFLTLFLWSRQDGWAGDVINIPMRLDPLLVLSHLLASRIFLASSALALIIIFITLLFGRAWCGWLCPLGTTLDLVALHRWRGKQPVPPEGWRGVKYALLLILLAIGAENPAPLRRRSRTGACWVPWAWVRRRSSPGNRACARSRGPWTGSARDARARASCWC